MKHPGPTIRLFVEDSLSEGAVVGLSATQAHYVKNVVRVTSGQEALLFNGRDGEWSARIDGQGKGWCSLSVGGRVRAQSSGADLWLVFAPIKRARIDFIAQKATELGVSGLRPAFTQHTTVTGIKADRLRANAVEAAEQCARLNVPEIFEPAPLDAVLADWPAARRILLCDDSLTAPPIAQALAGLGDQRAVPWAVFTGPEGGYAPKELDALKKLPFVTPVGLGARLLRADTAALAAIACWQAIVGDWQNGRPGSA